MAPTPAQIRSLYRTLLREGKRFPSKNRAGLVREIKEGEAPTVERWGGGGRP